MHTTEARVSQEELDAIQVACGRVPILDFRLLPDCAICLWLADQPATSEWNLSIRAHALDEHLDVLITG
jgi:hypothetical protein